MVFVGANLRVRPNKVPMSSLQQNNYRISYRRDGEKEIYKKYNKFINIEQNR